MYFQIGKIGLPASEIISLRVSCHASAIRLSPSEAPHMSHAGIRLRLSSMTLACALALQTVALPAPVASRSKPAAVATNAAAFAAKTRSAERHAGLLTTWFDRKGGKLLLELPAPRGPRGECGSF